MNVKYELLTNDNFLLFCARHYDNPQCKNVAEFNEDLKRLKYIKKLLTRYEKNGDLKERLVLNHLIILNNVFGPIALVKILCLKLMPQMKYIKPFLIFMQIMPDVIYNIDSKNIHSDDIGLDAKIIERLRKLNG